MRKCLLTFGAFATFLSSGVLAVLLSSCGAETKELPAPADLFAAIQAETELPQMVDTAETDLEALTGIRPDSYDSAVCCRLYEGTAPDEIIIVQSRDSEAAAEIQTRLENRLEYKRESGRLYLTEYQPMLQAGTVRRDGLTVSLIVSEQAAEIAQVYDSFQ